MRQNVLAFLADLFYILEVRPAKCVRPPGLMRDRFPINEGNPIDLPLCWPPLVHLLFVSYLRTEQIISRCYRCYLVPPPCLLISGYWWLVLVVGFPIYIYLFSRRKRKKRKEYFREKFSHIPLAELFCCCFLGGGSLSLFALSFFSLSAHTSPSSSDTPPDADGGQLSSPLRKSFHRRTSLQPLVKSIPDLRKGISYNTAPNDFLNFIRKSPEWKSPKKLACNILNLYIYFFLFST